MNKKVLKLSILSLTILGVVGCFGIDSTTDSNANSSQDLNMGLFMEGDSIFSVDSLGNKTFVLDVESNSSNDSTLSESEIISLLAANNENNLSEQDILNLLSEDKDGDGIPNIKDPDLDGDGITLENDDDIDGDGILNINDNDIDGDAVPNGLDGDIDGDGLLNIYDLDFDGDGITNDLDNDIDGDGITNELDSDMDGDNIFNTSDSDIDGDGLTNDLDDDIDSDGIANENDFDMDGDGIPNQSDNDIDGDNSNNYNDTSYIASNSYSVLASQSRNYWTDVGVGTLTGKDTSEIDFDELGYRISSSGIRVESSLISDIKLSLNHTENKSPYSICRNKLYRNYRKYGFSSWYYADVYYDREINLCHFTNNGNYSNSDPDIDSYEKIYWNGLDQWLQNAPNTPIQLSVKSINEAVTHFSSGTNLTISDLADGVSLKEGTLQVSANTISIMESHVHNFGETSGATLPLVIIVKLDTASPVYYEVGVSVEVEFSGKNY